MTPEERLEKFRALQRLQKFRELSAKAKNVHEDPAAYEGSPGAALAIAGRVGNIFPGTVRTAVKQAKNLDFNGGELLQALEGKAPSAGLLLDTLSDIGPGLIYELGPKLFQKGAKALYPSLQKLLAQSEEKALQMPAAHTAVDSVKAGLLSAAKKAADEPLLQGGILSGRVRNFGRRLYNSAFDLVPDGDLPRTAGDVMHSRHTILGVPKPILTKQGVVDAMENVADKLESNSKDIASKASHGGAVVPDSALQVGMTRARMDPVLSRNPFAQGALNSADVNTARVVTGKGMNLSVAEDLKRAMQKVARSGKAYTGDGAEAATAEIAAIQAKALREGIEHEIAKVDPEAALHYAADNSDLGAVVGQLPAARRAVPKGLGSYFGLSDPATFGGAYAIYGNPATAAKIWAAKRALQLLGSTGAKTGAGLLLEGAGKLRLPDLAARQLIIQNASPWTLLPAQETP